MNSAPSNEIILVIDDEPLVLEITQQLLNGYYATVFSAASALEGLETVQIHRPHLIVSDIGMPQMDGLQFIRKLRSLSSHLGGHTPAIALSGFTQPLDHVKSLEAGFQQSPSISKRCSIPLQTCYETIPSHELVYDPSYQVEAMLLR